MHRSATVRATSHTGSVQQQSVQKYASKEKVGWFCDGSWDTTSLSAPTLVFRDERRRSVANFSHAGTSALTWALDDDTAIVVATGGCGTFWFTT